MELHLTKAAILCISVFVLFADARFVHRKSRVPGVKRILKGFIRSDPVRDAKGQDTGLIRIADIATELFSDVVIYDETEEDDFNIVNCQYLWKRQVYHVAIKGKDADKADFDSGTTFIIRRSTWTEKCPGAYLKPKSMPSQEQTLFFNITSCTGESGKKLQLKMVPTLRKNAVGRIKYAVQNGLVKKHLVKKRVNFERNKDDLATSRASFSYSNFSFIKTERALTVEKEYEIPIDSGITATLTLSITGGTENFDGDYDASLTDPSASASFEAFVTGTATAEISIGAKRTVGYQNELFNEAIPSLGYTIPIPLVEDLSVGVFFSLDFVAELEAKLLATYSTTFEFNKRVRVSVQLYPGAPPSAEILERTGDGSSSLEASSEADIGATITGFVGVKPAVGLGVTLSKVGSGSADISVQTGIEASVSISQTPNQPVAGGITFGVCDECHYAQGPVSVVAKNLDISFNLFDEEGSTSIASVLFKKEIGTICAVPASCEAGTCGGSCTTSLDCASGEICGEYSGENVCLNDIPNLDSCDPLPECSVCSGSCVRGTCFSAS